MLLYKNSYKGKWIIYDDEEDDYLGSEGTVNSEDITDEELLNHARACRYYGIPMYYGSDKEFRDRCATAASTLEELTN